MELYSLANRPGRRNEGLGILELGQILLEDLVLLQVRPVADTGCLCLFVHGVGDGYIRISQADGGEADERLVVLTTGLLAGEDALVTMLWQKISSLS